MAYVEDYSASQMLPRVFTQSGPFTRPATTAVLLAPCEKLRCFGLDRSKDAVAVTGRRKRQLDDMGGSEVSSLR